VFDSGVSPAQRRS